MAQIPKMSEVAYLPGINPKDYKTCPELKPTNFAEAWLFLRKPFCKVVQKWNEDVDFITVTLKVSNDSSDDGVTKTIQIDTPGDLRGSEPQILRLAQELWAYRKCMLENSYMAEKLGE